MHKIRQIITTTIINTQCVNRYNEVVVKITGRVLYEKGSSNSISSSFSTWSFGVWEQK